MKTSSALLMFLCSFCFAQSDFENNRTVTYDEAISIYDQLDKKHNKAMLLPYSITDAGKPLHLFVISADGDFNPPSLKKKNRRIILINNGIHPGEPEGIDASIKLAKELLDEKSGATIPDNVVVCIIPVYNIGGSLNRGCCSRANQNGPEEYGFRGNSRNLDLNRDFIKCDSENAKAFATIFHLWDPDVFIDTHTSNGADYPYVMTLIATQHNKLHPLLGKFMDEEMTPALYENMILRRYEMIPYVNSISETPDSGIIDYMETPRYSTGYAALFNTIGYVTETHMLKPFRERVFATYQFFHSVMNYVSVHAEKIGKLREQAKEETAVQQKFTLDWKLDTTQYKMIPFKGYVAKKKLSAVTGLERLWYDTTVPYQRDIRYYNTYIPAIAVEKPVMYILPQAYKEISELLILNGITMERLTADATMAVEVYYITNYTTSKKPFESHYLHSDVTVRKEKQSIRYYKGDYLIPVNQTGNRYIVETLEPQAPDSWFCWNFFDNILQQKEWFSDYVFEEKAEELLQRDSLLRKEFETKKEQDSTFAKNANVQLRFVYERSPYFEKSYRRYPVARMMKNKQ